MSLTTTNPGDHAQVVLFEVVAHLLELDERPIEGPLELTDAWAELHACDDEVLGVLDPGDRRAYQIVVDTSRARPRAQRTTSGPIVEVRATRLRLAIRRRLLVLRDL